MGGRGRKKPKLSYWYYSTFTKFDNGNIIEYKTMGLGFSPSDFPNPIIEVDQWGRTFWYGYQILYNIMDSLWESKISRKFPEEIIYLRREYRTPFALGWRFPIAPYPQVEKVYNGNFQKANEVSYDRVVDVTNFYK